jgi:crotonobetainyl-CoA:carnitine CoA-transferase CaiB-like acyl-CoA transferase
MLPLEGCNVLELAVWRPGPYAGRLLADLGADVVKVEPPGGDPMRYYEQLFASTNAGKRSVALNLKDAADRAACVELARDAHVVLEGFRPGVADRLGVGPDQLRAVQPGLVYVSVSGFGATGPLRDLPGHDVNYMGWAGALRGGEEAGLAVGDLSAGMTAALAAVAGYTRALRSGDGAFVDIGMTDVLAQWAGLPGPAGETTKPPSYGVFEAADGLLTLGVTAEDPFWRSLCGVLGLPDDAAALPFAERMARVGPLRSAVTVAVRGRGRDELLAALRAADVPSGPVNDAAAMASEPHLRERGIVVDDADGQPACGPLLRFPGTPIGAPPPVPALDEHRGATFRLPIRRS